MFVLAQLIPSPLCTSPEVGSHPQTSRVRFGDRKTEEGDEQTLQRFSDILLGLKKDATFDALLDHLPFTWVEHERYDTVSPFGDSRPFQYQALWTFDTHDDLLRFVNRNGRSQIPLALLRERAVSLADMESLGGPFPKPVEPTLDSDLPYWQPKIVVDDRMRAFAHRLLRAFYYQWRHILRNHYNCVTLRVLAKAIIRLSTLDFEVRYNTGGHGVLPETYVWIMRLPSWEPFKAGIVRVGNVYVLPCEEIQEGLSMAQEHLLSQKFNTTESSSTSDTGTAQANYMILSVRHIMLCRASGQNSLEYTAPEPLFNGDFDTGPPSDLALDYLIWATASARPSISTSLHSLPIEVQNLILSYLPGGTVVAAQIGCLLNLGSPCLWRDGPLTVELQEKYHTRPTGSPVESHIWFDGHKSGIVYRAKRSFSSINFGPTSFKYPWIVR